MKKNYKQTILALLILLISLTLGCKKLTQVPEPVNTITTTETFSNNVNATAAIIGIYNDVSTGHGRSGNGLAYGSGLTTLDCGMSADELIKFNNSSQFQSNTLNSSNGDINLFWIPLYYDLYMANAAIGSLPNSPGVDQATKKQLMGEAQFFRAFCDFYLVNLFGNVPLVVTTNYLQTDTLHRSSTNQVYQSIISDLKAAQIELAADYSASGGERTRVNQAGATALLARVYLYTGDWKDAEAQATVVINNNLFSLQTDLNQVFLADNSEAILQWQTVTTAYDATEEGIYLIPANSISPPTYYLTNSLLSGFEAGDNRRIDWIDSTYYAGQYYYYPYKYKVRKATSITEYYMVLRLAEQYLIRAEARTEQNNLTGPTGAISDLNTIRERAGLPDLSQNLSQTQVLAAVAQERRIELFAEWGHRWLDLKRTGQAVTVLTANKKITVPAYQLLYPIPANELIDDNNLVQNPGY